MARKVRIGGGPKDDNRVFIGEDLQLQIAVVESETNPVPVDVTGMEFQFVVKASVDDADEDAKISKAGTPTGVFNEDPEQNEQRVIVPLTAADLSADVFEAKTYQQSLKRTDDGSKRIIIYGPFIVEKATQV